MGWRQIIRNIRTDRVAEWLFGLAFLVNLIDWSLVQFLSVKNGTMVPVHYTIYFGINLTGPWMMLYWLPAIGTIVLISHLLISAANQQPVWRRLWMLLALTLNLLALANTVAILYLTRTYGL